MTQQVATKPLNWNFFDGGGNEEVLDLGPLNYRRFPAEGGYHLYRAFPGQDPYYQHLHTLLTQEAVDAAVREHAQPLLKKLREDLEAAEAALA